MIKLIVLVFVLSSLTFSKVSINCDLESGYIPYNASLLQFSAQELEYTCYQQTFYLTLSPKFQWKFLYCDLDASYFALPTRGDINFTPFRWVFGGEYGTIFNFKSFGLMIGYANNCSHKIVPQIYKKPNSTEYIDNAYNKIFVKVSWSNSQL